MYSVRQVTSADKANRILNDEYDKLFSETKELRKEKAAAADLKTQVHDGMIGVTVHIPFDLWEASLG